YVTLLVVILRWLPVVVRSKLPMNGLRWIVV
ncbi:hypothetical protein BV202_00494B, partial [Haemophilus influenzae]